MDMSRRVVPALSLESLPRRQRGVVASIDWARLAGPEARRLRELGFDEGVAVEVLQPCDARQRPDRVPDRADDGGAASWRSPGAIHVAPAAG